MGLQRWGPTTRYIGTGEWMGDMEQDDEGDFYSADEVDALLARIRAAAEAERESGHRLMEMMDDWYCERPQSGPPFSQAKDLDAKGAALDALLTGEGGE